MNCRVLFWQPVRLDFSFAFPKTGNSMLARIAMIAITTNSSIKVKPARLERASPTTAVGHITDSLLAQAVEGLPGRCAERNAPSRRGDVLRGARPGIWRQRRARFHVHGAAAWIVDRE